jgi:glycosyltransferase involved in cell wall biosynthesis
LQPGHLARAGGIPEIVKTKYILYYMLVLAITAPPRLSGIICTHDRYAVLGGAIDSLLAQRVEPGFLEIIVIDNSPGQAAAAEFGARYAGIPNLRYVLEPVAGLSRARNIGISLAQADIAGFIDDDAIAAPHWAAAIVKGFADFGPRAGALGGPVKPRWLNPRPGWLGDALLNYIGVVNWGGKLREISHQNGLVGCNMALDRQLVTSLGGFSTTLGRTGAGTTLLSNEEPDLFARMQAAGRAIVYAPEAEVEHLINPERLNQNWFRRRAAWQAVSDYLMDPAKARQAALDAAEHLKWVASKNARRRGLGFFGDVEDAAEFSAEFFLMYYSTLANLSGGAEIPEMRPGEKISPPEHWAVRLRMRHRDLAVRRPGYARFANSLRPMLNVVKQLIGVQS